MVGANLLLRAFFAIVTVLIGGLILYNVGWLSAIQNTNTKTAFSEITEAGDGEAFLRDKIMAMIAMDVLVLDTETFEVISPDCSASAQVHAEAPVQSRRTASAADLASMYCRGIFQDAIGAKIRAWNEALKLAAIRDTSAAAKSVPDGLWVRPSGDIQSEWSAASLPDYAEKNPRAAEILLPADITEGGAPSPDIYGFAQCAGLRTGYGDWLSVRGNMLKISREVEPGDKFSLQLLGQIQEIRSTVKSVSVKPVHGLCGRPEDQLGRGRRCQRDFSARTCDFETADIKVVSVRAEDAGIVELTVKTKPVAPPRLARFKNAAYVKPTSDQDWTGWVDERIGRGPLGIACRPYIGGEECSLRWTGAPLPLQSATPPQLLVEDFGPVTDLDGRLLANVEDELGLISAIGPGVPDYLSISRLLPPPNPVQLSIDPDYQAATHRVVQAALDNPGLFSGVRLPGALPLTGISKANNAAGYLKESRTASIVLMDASDSADAGQILAASSWPELPKGLHDWDIQALRSWSVVASPLEPRSWMTTETPQTPGSSFKIVAALAAIQAALDSEDSVLQDLILGVDGDTYESHTGLACSENVLTLPTEDKTVLDINNSFSTGACAGAGNYTQCLQTRENGHGPIGLCEAIGISNNIWFSQITLQSQLDFRADLSEARQLQLCSRSPGDEDRFYLRDVQDRLDWKRGLNLLTGASDKTSVGYVRAEPPILDAVAKNRADDELASAFCLDLALNAYGQAMQATPLSMATFAAGIARANLTSPVPRLTELPVVRNGDESVAAPLPLIDTPPGRESDRDEMIQALRSGMSAVINSPNGSAARAFCVGETDNGDCDLMASLRPRVFAKTGTATLNETKIEERRNYSAWLVGWVEPAESSGIQNRIAFACMVTHTRGRSGYGGSICGPMMARLLLDLDQGTY